MAEFADREHYIPIRKPELVEMLCAGGGPDGDRALSAIEGREFRAFCDLVGNYFHLDYFKLLEHLKDAYAPFDPDADTRDIATASDNERGVSLDRLFKDFDLLLERGNFRKLSKQELIAATEAVSDWGINLDVELECFEQLEVYFRGDVVTERTRRRAWNWWRLETLRVPTYQRLVVILKQKAHKRLGKGVDTRNVFLKMFKDIPKPDVEMLLPGGRVMMPRFDRGKLGASMLGSLGYIGYKIAIGINEILLNAWGFVGPLGLVLGYGYKQYAAFQNVRVTYSHQLSKSLYYQNLDNNAGVLFRLLDAAEEQECREAILAYFHLWRHAGDAGWTADALDDHVELDLERRIDLKVDFEIADALGKLERLRLVERIDDRYRAVPIEAALKRISESSIAVTDALSQSS